MKGKVQDVDKGYKALVKRVFSGGSPKVSVGIHAAEGGAQDGAATVAQVASWNEFGTDTIPERSFLRAYIDTNDARLRQMLVELMRRAIKGKLTKAQVLELLGSKMVGEIQARISAGIDPANAPSTVARKGSSTPLIDTGVLRSSITHTVTE